MLSAPDSTTVRVLVTAPLLVGEVLHFPSSTPLELHVDLAEQAIDEGKARHLTWTISRAYGEPMSLERAMAPGRPRRRHDRLTRVRPTPPSKLLRHRSPVAW